MKMSSCGSGLEGSSVAQHRPHDVDPPTRQGDQSLGVPLALSSLAVVEGPGLRGATQAGKGRLVEDPLEDFIAPAHPAALADSLAGVSGGWHKTGVSGELIGTLENGEVSYSHQELGPEDRTHPRQASEDPSLGTGEKTLLKLLIQGLDALSLRASASWASSATRRLATPSAGSVTLWAFAASRAFRAMPSAPLTPRFLRELVRRERPILLMAAGVW